jgi:4-hydroxy-tetrahydrodipicolinate reductase
LLAKRNDVTIVGAIDNNPTQIGRDLGELLQEPSLRGIRVSSPQAIDHMNADVALHATTAFAAEAYPIVASLAARGTNVVTITQELFFPLGSNIGVAEEIDRQAKAGGARVTAVGINPGFILDVLPISASSPCWEINRVDGRRVVDFSPYGPDEMRHIGAGLTQSEFVLGAKDGTIGHIGLLESAGMVAVSMGLEVDELRQTKSAIISLRRRRTSFVEIELGRVCGFRQTVIGLSKGVERLCFEMVGILDPDDRDDPLGDRIRISGSPAVDLVMKEQIAQLGGLGTAAVAVNTIPRLLNAAPGFHTSQQLRTPSIWSKSENRSAVIRTNTTVLESAD